MQCSFNSRVPFSVNRPVAGSWPEIFCLGSCTCCSWALKLWNEVRRVKQRLGRLGLRVGQEYSQVEGLVGRDGQR